MTMAETAAMLQAITALYPMSKIRADVPSVKSWQKALEDLPAEAVSVALRRMVSTLKFPPTVADIREAVAKAVQEARGVPTAGEAWGRVKRAASWYGYYRPEDARRALGEDIWRAVQQVGGWREICAGDSPDGVISAQFERRYNAMITQQAERVQIPASVREDMARLVGPLAERFLIGGDEP